MPQTNPSLEACNMNAVAIDVISEGNDGQLGEKAFDWVRLEVGSIEDIHGIAKMMYVLLK